MTTKNFVPLGFQVWFPKLVQYHDWRLMRKSTLVPALWRTLLDLFASRGCITHARLSGRGFLRVSLRSFRFGNLNRFRFFSLFFSFAPCYFRRPFFHNHSYCTSYLISEGTVSNNQNLFDCLFVRREIGCEKCRVLVYKILCKFPSFVQIEITFSHVHLLCD